MTSKSFIKIAFVFLFIISCGGGGGKYFPPKIALNKIGIEKKEFEPGNQNLSDKINLEVDLKRDSLPNTFIGGTQYYQICDFKFNNKKYKLAIPYRNFVSIIGKNGDVLKKLDTPRYATNAGAMELIDPKNNLFIAVYVGQQATSHSSTLFILNEKLETVYKEHLLGAQWMAKEITEKGSNLVVSAEKQWIPKNKWISVGGPWRYTFAQ